jgi:hypothetical protein
MPKVRHSYYHAVYDIVVERFHEPIDAYLDPSVLRPLPSYGFKAFWRAPAQ